MTNYKLFISNYNFQLTELGSVLQNICSLVPSGIVCFFPSYDYEKLVYNHLEKTQILTNISLKKQIFREPKSSSDVDKTLALYAKAIKNCSDRKNGALLFSVVGKLIAIVIHLKIQQLTCFINSTTYIL